MVKGTESETVPEKKARGVVEDFGDLLKNYDIQRAVMVNREHQRNRCPTHYGLLLHTGRLSPDRNLDFLIDDATNQQTLFQVPIASHPE